MNIRRLIVIAIVSFLSLNLEAQVSEAGQPLSLQALMVHSQENTGGPLLVLIAYDDELANLIEERFDTARTPLFFSVSALPFSESEFRPGSLCFSQNDKTWRPKAEAIQPLNDSKFGGSINGNEVQQALIWLPARFDVVRPLVIQYEGTRVLLAVP